MPTAGADESLDGTNNQQYDSLLEPVEQFIQDSDLQYNDGWRLLLDGNPCQYVRELASIPQVSHITHIREAWEIWKREKEYEKYEGSIPSTGIYSKNGTRIMETSLPAHKLDLGGDQGAPIQIINADWHHRKDSLKERLRSRHRLGKTSGVNMVYTTQDERLEKLRYELTVEEEARLPERYLLAEHNTY